MSETVQLVFTIIFLVIVLGCGIVVLVSGIRMRREKFLPDFMVAKEERDKITDRKAFAFDLSRSVFILGVTLTVLGVESLLNVAGLFAAIGQKARLIDGVFVGIFLIAFLYFTKKFGNCRDKYIVTGLK